MSIVTHRVAIAIFVTLTFVLFTNGCGKPSQQGPQPVEQVIPSIPANTDFGGLYPRVSAYLQLNPPDIVSAVRDTVTWARANLDGFHDGGCASIQVVADVDFARIFGRSTLGATLPWMEIYIRDGARDPESFLWKDPSLLVSTVLHESVHAAQRTRQAAAWLGTNGCEAARRELNQRRPTWNIGFDSLRLNPVLNQGFAVEDRALLYRWISPIERARDEVEAALQTVQWMKSRPEELNEFTLGGANNWAYGVQFLNQLKTLGTSNCFSPDGNAFSEELGIYEREVPLFNAGLASLAKEMNVFITQYNVSASRLQLSDAAVQVTPSGREGARCGAALQAELSPSYPVYIQ